jgi:hypothetical protein
MRTRREFIKLVGGVTAAWPLYPDHLRLARGA